MSTRRSFFRKALAVVIALPFVRALCGATQYPISAGVAIAFDKRLEELNANWFACPRCSGPVEKEKLIAPSHADTGFCSYCKRGVWANPELLAYRDQLNNVIQQRILEGRQRSLNDHWLKEYSA